MYKALDKLNNQIEKLPAFPAAFLNVILFFLLLPALPLMVLYSALFVWDCNTPEMRDLIGCAMSEKQKK